MRKGLQFTTANDKETNRRWDERNLLIFNQYLWWLPSPCASARVSFLSTSAFLAFVVDFFFYVRFAVRFLNIVLHLNCYCFFCGFGAKAAVAVAVDVAILLLLLFCSILVSPLGDARLTHACIINNCIISLCVAGVCVSVRLRCQFCCFWFLYCCCCHCNRGFFIIIWLRCFYGCRCFSFFLLLCRLFVWVFHFFFFFSSVLVFWPIPFLQCNRKIVFGFVFISISFCRCCCIPLCIYFSFLFFWSCVYLIRFVATFGPLFSPGLLTLTAQIFCRIFS